MCAVCCLRCVLSVCPCVCSWPQVDPQARACLCIRKLLSTRWTGTERRTSIDVTSIARRTHIGLLESSGRMHSTSGSYALSPFEVVGCDPNAHSAHARHRHSAIALSMSSPPHARKRTSLQADSQFSAIAVCAKQARPSSSRQSIAATNEARMQQHLPKSSRLRWARQPPVDRLEARQTRWPDAAGREPRLGRERSDESTEGGTGSHASAIRYEGAHGQHRRSTHQPNQIKGAGNTKGKSGR